MNSYEILFVIRLVMSYVPMKELAILSVVYPHLRKEALSLYKVGVRRRGSKINEDLERQAKGSTASLDDTVPYGDRYFSFENIGSHYIHAPVPFLSTITGELDLSGSTIDADDLNYCQDAANPFSLWL